MDSIRLKSPGYRFRVTLGGCSPAHSEWRLCASVSCTNQSIHPCLGIVILAGYKVQLLLETKTISRSLHLVKGSIKKVGVKMVGWAWFETVELFFRDFMISNS